jgi:hypothetical protein
MGKGKPRHNPDKRANKKGVELKRAINEHEEEVRKLAEILQDKDNIKGYDTMYIQGEEEIVFQSLSHRGSVGKSL